MSFWQNMLTNGAGHAGAYNAHLAELTLPSVPLGRRPQIIEEMAHILRKGSHAYASLDDHGIIELFNSFPRVVQLNFLVLSMRALGYPPSVPGEDWLALRNPLYSESLMDDKDIAVSAGHFMRKHGISVSICREPMSLSEWAFPQTKMAEKAEKVIIECPACHQRLRVTSGRRGRVACSNCEHTFEVDLRR